MAHFPGIIRKFLGRFWPSKDGQQQHQRSSRRANDEEIGPSFKRRTRATSDGPVLSQCSYGDGGVQGLKWYSENLSIDEDGDIAQEFLVVGETPNPVPSRICPQKNVKVHMKPVKLKGSPVCSPDGNVHQFVEAMGEVHRA